MLSGTEMSTCSGVKEEMEILFSGVDGQRTFVN